MNQHVIMPSNAIMSVNKYPWKEAFLLFGASNKAGAQNPVSK